MSGEVFEERTAKRAKTVSFTAQSTMELGVAQRKQAGTLFIAGQIDSTDDFVKEDLQKAKDLMRVCEY